MSRPLNPEKIRAEVAGLGALPFAALKARYEDLTGEAPPKRIGRKLLILAVAYELQRQPQRQLVARVHRRLETFDKKRGQAKMPGALSQRKMKSGGRLIREWRGKTHEVYVAEDGVYWHERRYSSLSAAAEAITGVKRNGPAFFGLRSPKAAS